MTSTSKHFCYKSGYTRILFRCRLLVLLFFWTHPALADSQGLALDIRWIGADLIDEMVHDWELHPPFSGPTLTALTEIDGPVGLDERFSVVVENQLVDRVTALSATHVRLAHCSACRKWVVKSSKAGTYFGRGVDQPELMRDLSSAGGAKHGLSLSFEAAAKSVVLRAQIFSLTEVGQPIVWAKSYTTMATARAAMQNDEPLVTLADARAKQDAIIHKQDPLEFVSRVTFRMFSMASSGSTNTSRIAPVLFAEQSIEGVLLPRRNRRMAFTVGVTSIEKTMSGYSVGGHFAQLLFRDEPSLVNPDVYFFGGFQFVRLRGPGAAPFAQEQLDIAKIRGDNKEPRASFVAYRLGLEAHVKNRFGLMAFLENIPAFDKSQIIAKESLLGIPYHDMGFGMVVKW